MNQPSQKNPLGYLVNSKRISFDNSEINFTN